MRISRKEIERRKRLMVKLFAKKAGSVSALCKEAEISRKTFYEWMKEDADFQSEVEEARESLVDFAESKLLENIAAGKEQSILFMLKTKGKVRGWVEQQHVHHSGSTQQLTGITVEIIHTERNAQNRNA